MSDEQAAYDQTERDAKAQAHVGAEHVAWLLAGVLDACEKILLATEAIAEPNARLAFIDELYTAVRRTVSVGETMNQLEVTVREKWEHWRGK